MLEPVREPRFALEVGEEMLAHRALVRNLQRDVQAMDRIDGLVDRRDRPFGNAPLDAVFAEFLSCFERHESAAMVSFVSRRPCSRTLVVILRPPAMIPADGETVNSRVLPFAREPDRFMQHSHAHAHDHHDSRPRAWALARPWPRGQRAQRRRWLRCSRAASWWPRSSAASSPARWRCSPTPATCSRTSRASRSPGSASGSRASRPIGAAPTASTASRCSSRSSTASRCSRSPRGSSSRPCSGSTRPSRSSARPMLWIAAAGLAVNVLAFLVLRTGDKDNLNIRAAVLHVIGDLLGSVAAVIAALVILATGWMPIDPLLSMVVALIILRSAWRVVADSGHILLEGVAAGRRLAHAARPPAQRAAVRARRASRARLVDQPRAADGDAAREHRSEHRLGGRRARDQAPARAALPHHARDDRDRVRRLRRRARSSAC